MNGEMPFFEVPAMGERAERKAMREASDILKKPGNLTLSIQTLLFCLLIAFAWITATQLLVIPFEYALMQLESVSGMLLLEGAYYLISGILLILLVLPVWLGRLRVAGRMCADEAPMVREVLYYFTSFARYKRALFLSLMLAVQVLVPLALCAGAFFGAFELYFQVFSFDLPPVAAVALLVGSLLIALVFSVGVLFLTGFYQMTLAIAIGNEELSPFGAFRLALRQGRKNLLTLFCFTLRSLWHLLLSLVTFGVLFVLWYAHHYITSHLRLSMALCPKGETQS